MTRNPPPGTEPAPTPSAPSQVNERPETRAPGNGLTHGAYRFRDTGELPAFATEVASELDALIDGYVTDLGGEVDVTTGQRELLDLLRTVAGMRRLVEIDLARRGLMTARGRVRASSHLLMALVDREERLIKQLGLTRKPKPTRTLADWIADQPEDESDDSAR